MSSPRALSVINPFDEERDGIRADVLNGGFGVGVGSAVLENPDPFAERAPGVTGLTSEPERQCGSGDGATEQNPKLSSATFHSLELERRQCI